MKNDLEKIIKSAREIRLQDDERIAVRNSILKVVNSTRVISPYSNYFISRYFISATFLLIFLVGGTSYFANNSLPGEIMYPMKLNFNENLELISAITPEGIAEVSAIQAGRRISEAEVLLEKNSLTPELNVEIQRQFSKKYDSYNKRISKIKSTDDSIESIDSNPTSIISETSTFIRSESNKIATTSKEKIDDKNFSEKKQKSKKIKDPKRIKAEFDSRLDRHEENLEKLSRNSTTSPAREILKFVKEKRGKKIEENK